jgi:hypothetical protein
MSKRLFLLISLLVTQFSVAANTANSVAAANANTKEAFLLSYEGMYDRLKVLNKGNYQYADIGFYLVTDKGAVCPVTHVELITSSRNQTITVGENARLYLPFDEQMDKDKALVAVSTENNEICHLKLQLEAQINDNFVLTQANAYTIKNEFEELMGGLSGFFVRNLMPFLMPDVTGITVTLSDSMALHLPDIKCEASRCVVTPEKEWQDQNMQLLDGVKIKAIQPFISQQ